MDNMHPVVMIKTRGNDMDNMLTVEEVGLIMQGKPILAIKSVRTRLALDLRDAKYLVDSYAIAMGKRVEDVCHYCGGAGKVGRYI